MYKRDLVRKLATRLDITVSDTNIIVDEIINIFNETLLNKESITIPGWMGISIKPHAAYRYINSKTGEEVWGEPYYKLHVSMNKKLYKDIKSLKLTDEDMEVAMAKSKRMSERKAQKEEEAKLKIMEENNNG